MMKYAAILFVFLIHLGTGSSVHAQVTPQRVRVAPSVAADLRMKWVPPKYPADAKDRHIEGAVVLKIHVDKEGKVADTAFVSGPSALVPAAIEAVKQWKYFPFLLNGDPVAMQTQVTVKFALPK